MIIPFVPDPRRDWLMAYTAMRLHPEQSAVICGRKVWLASDDFGAVKVCSRETAGRGDAFWLLNRAAFLRRRGELDTAEIYARNAATCAGARLP